MNHTSFVIGRFQPFHQGHKALIQKALSVSKRVVIFLGSSTEDRTKKNPFRPLERASMVLDSFDAREQKRIIFVLLPDYESNDLWLDHISNSLDVINQGPSTYTFVCCDKDKDTAYNNNLVSGLPNVDTYLMHSPAEVEATTIRKLLEEKKLLCDIPGLNKETLPKLGEYRKRVEWYSEQ